MTRLSIAGVRASGVAVSSFVPHLAAVHRGGSHPYGTPGSSVCRQLRLPQVSFSRLGLVRLL